jgi:hypothetical protein
MGAWLMVCFLLPLCLVTASQAEPTESDTKHPAWMVVARQHAAECNVVLHADRSRPLTMIPDPVLHRAQEVQGSSKGSTFLWKESSGRPAVIGDVMISPQGTEQFRVGNEWHSLCDRPLEVRWSGQALLSTSQPGLEWKPLAEAPLPADKPTQRQRQARQFAERFTAHLLDRKRTRFELRLLTTPLLRYDTTETATSLGGALFAFCQQTDPEVLLLIEARKSGAEYRWEYAIAGFSDMDLYVQMDGKAIWEDVPAFSRGRGVHTGGRVKIVRIADELEAARRQK